MSADVEQFDGWDVTLFGGGMGGDLNFLKRRNPVPSLDTGMRFDDSLDPQTGEKRHDYWIVDPFGERRYHGSCTGLIGEYKRHFDAAAAYAGMKRKGRIVDPDDEYFGKSLEQCKAEWASNSEESQEHGSRVHAEIELFYNNATNWPTKSEWLDDCDTSPALQRFLMFHLEWVVPQRMVPFRTELIIWDEEFEFTGQCDIVFQREEWRNDPVRRNWVILGDWKRTKKKLLTEEAYRDERMFGCCSSLPNVSLSEYKLQLTLYALILQRRTPFIVVELHIGVFHANNTSYQWITIEPLYDIAAQMLIERRQKLLFRYSQKMLEITQEVAIAEEIARQLGEVVGASDAVANFDAARGLHGLLKSQIAFDASNETVMGATSTSREKKSAH